MSAKIRFPSYTEVMGLELGEVLIAGYVLVMSVEDGSRNYVRIEEAMKVGGFRRIFKRALRFGFPSYASVVSVGYEWHIAVDRHTLTYGFVHYNPPFGFPKMTLEHSWWSRPVKDVIARLLDKAYLRDSGGRFK